MNYPNCHIKDKNEYIDTLIINGDSLSDEVRAYKREFRNFNAAYEDLVLEKELKNLDLDLREIIHYLNEIETNLNNLYRYSRTEEKKEETKTMLSRVTFLKTKGIKYLKDFTIDNYNRSEFNVISFCKEIERKLSIRNLSNPFFSMNEYTGEIEYNVSAIEAGKRIFNGDKKLYNKLDKVLRLIKKEPNKKEELLSELPEWLSGVSIEDLNTILCIASKGISEVNLDTLASDVDFLSAFVDVENGKYTSMHGNKIVKYIMKLVGDIINGFVSIEELVSLDILKYFDSNTNPYKFREYLRKYNYDLDKIVEVIRDDELISSTSMSKPGSLLFGHDGINYKNVNLLAEYANGNTSIYRDLKDFYKSGDQRLLKNIPEDIFGAEIHVLDRAIHVQPFSRVNRKAYEKDRYDLRILQAIGMYKKSPKLEEISEETIKEHKTML